MCMSPTESWTAPGCCCCFLAGAGAAGGGAVAAAAVVFPRGDFFPPGDLDFSGFAVELAAAFDA